MRCSDARELFSAYLDDMLDSEQRRAFEAHLRECPACAGELAQLRRTIHLVTTLEEVDPPADFHDQLLARIARIEAAGEPGAAAADAAKGAPKNVRFGRFGIAGINALIGRYRMQLAAGLALILVFAGGMGLGNTLRVAHDRRQGEMLAQTQGVAGNQSEGGKSAPPTANNPALGAPTVTSGQTAGTMADSGLGAGAATAKAFTADATSAPYGDYATTPENQKLVRTGSLRLAVRDVDAAVQRVGELATANGGYIQDSQFSKGNSGIASAAVVVRAPADKLDAVVAEVSKLGAVRDRTINSVDVTRQYTDNDATVKNLVVQESRLQEILTKAITVDDILRIENELSRVRSQIDGLNAMLRNLQSGVDMATLTVVLDEDPGTAAVSPGQGFGERLRGAFLNTIHAIGSGLVSAAVFISGAMPVLIALVVLWFVVRPLRWFKRGRGPDRTISS